MNGEPEKTHKKLSEGEKNLRARGAGDATGTTVKDLTGETTASIEVVRDINGHKYAEDGLSLFKAALESLPIGITIADLSGKIIYTNPADAEMHGYCQAELIGREPRIFSPQELWKPMAFEQLHDRGVWRRETVNIRKNGETFPVHLTSIAVKNAAGAPIGIVTACEDVTERKTMEERLRSAQKMEVIGKLAGGVAHEVRNPLNAVMSISEALFKDLGENREYRPFLDHIRVQVDRLSTLMNDLLDLGKSVEQFDLQREPLDEVCAASVDIWKHSGFRRAHEVSMHRTPDVDTVHVIADRRRLQQVFLNLLDNAAQHSPEGSEIRIMIDGPSAGMCRVSVVDRGAGVGEDIRPRIFEPFFSTRRGGVGLGMSIVKHIIELHGGAVAIANNDPPPGCTVDIRLPVADKDGP